MEQRNYFFFIKDVGFKATPYCKIGLHIVLAFEVQIGDKPNTQIWNSELFLANKLELVHQLLEA